MHKKNETLTRQAHQSLLCPLIWGKTQRAVTLCTNQQKSAALMVRKKISYLPALTTDLGCRGTEDSLSGAPDAKLTKSGSPLCCGEKSSRSYGEFNEPTVTETCTFQHVAQSLFGACCLRMLLHLCHYLDRAHSDLKQHLL